MRPHRQQPTRIPPPWDSLGKNTGVPFPSPVYESEKWKWSRSVMSDSLQSHGLQPTRLLCPWDSPGKSTGMGVPLPSPWESARGLKRLKHRWLSWSHPVSINGWMDKQNVVHTYSEILFSLKKEGNSDTYYNMDKLWGHYAKLNKPLTK